MAPERDELTGLPNRALLKEHLALALARARRAGTGVAVLHLGVDNFKLVNDSLGRAAGDVLLRRAGERLEQATRASDLLARPGADEFLLLLTDVQEDVTVAAERAARRIVDALEPPFEIAGTTFQVSVSIGISCAPRDAHDPETLLEAADAAMYRAKEVARGSYAHFARAERDPLERLAMTTRLRRALANDEFLLHYQPIFALPSGKLTGVEALIRWHDPERGMVPPGDFIPLAEETGLIEQIGDWVVGAVCAQQAEWARRGFEPQISFNVSPRQLRRLDFVPRVAHHLEVSGADAAKLTLELTESSTMEDRARAEPMLRELHEMGLRLALDDFGSGYSSLSRLREMPVEFLKIDRQFLQAVPEDRDASTVVIAVLSLARALGRTAVAEGVETEDQRAFLVAQGCRMAQGFLLGRPIPADEVERLGRPLTAAEAEALGAVPSAV